MHQNVHTMGFHYKNFIAVVLMCGAAFGGFFSFVYSAELAKSEVKNEEAVLGPEKRYNENDVARIHEAVVAAQRKLLEDEKRRLAAAGDDAKKKRVTPLAVPRESVAVIPSLPIVLSAPIALAPTTIISPVTATPVQTVQSTQPRTTVS